MEVKASQLDYAYGSRPALTGIDLTVRSQTITGLLGRNGAGKTTLCSLMAGERPSKDIWVDGENPWENERLAPQICFITPTTPVFDNRPISATVDLWNALRPSFDIECFARLSERFGLQERVKPGQLSRGTHALFLAALGIASRCGLTIFDEATDGMDEVSRGWFYDELLADYAQHPRTIILATHLISEGANLMEDVIVLARGHLAAAGPVDEVRQQFTNGQHLPSLTEVLQAVDGRR